MSRLTDHTGQSPVPFSVLDLSVVREGGDPRAALRETAELARAAEAHGYHRFWVAEHHNFPASASPAPAVLLAHLGGVTRSIRLGSGGVMLPHHAPLVVAEQFGVLNAFHPGRVDLGIGRSAGGFGAVTQALGTSEHSFSTEGFLERVQALSHYVRESGRDHRAAAPEDVQVVPAAPDLPLWILGSGTSGAEVAARLGMGFVAAYHITGERAVTAAQDYRAHFTPARPGAEPYVMLSVNTFCADTEEEALQLARSGALMMLRASRGEPSALPSPLTAQTYDYTADEREWTERWLGNVVHGTPATVREEITELLGRTAADEIMISSLIHDAAPRYRSHELVAGAFGLSGRPAPQGTPAGSLLDGRIG